MFRAPLLGAPYRGSDTSPFGVPTWVISAPNRIHGGPPAFAPTLDTLYLDETGVSDAGGPVGFPNAVFYHGPDNGPGSQLVWFGLPLHYFEREQVRTVVDAVMRNFGIVPAPPAARGGRVVRR